MHMVFACQEKLSFPTLKDLKWIQTLNHTYSFCESQAKASPIINWYTSLPNACIPSNGSHYLVTYQLIDDPTIRF
jgi:hypothetical protein